MDKKKIKDELLNLAHEGNCIYGASVAAYNDKFFINHPAEAQNLLVEAIKKFKNPHLDYRIWYTKALRAIAIFDSNSLADFEMFYKLYIQQWLIGIKNPYLLENTFNSFESGFRTQVHILGAIAENIDHELFNLEREIHHDIYKSELDIAKDLNKQGYLRASGAIAGVILEVHLKNLATNRGVMPKKKDPGMSDYNDALKDANVYDKTTWRQIQTCGDIRNSCVHPKEAEPIKYQIDTIISTVGIIITTYN